MTAAEQSYRPSSPVALLLDQLDELRAKATPGPWEHISDDHGRKGIEHSIWSDRALNDMGGYITDDPTAADAALIVGAVNAVGPLAAAVRNVLLFAETIDGHDERATATASLIRRAVSDGMAPVTP